MITKTPAQALTRARGIWGYRGAWGQGPTKQEAAERARVVLCKWLDGLTLIVRCPDLLHRKGIAGEVRELVSPLELHIGPYKVGDSEVVRGLARFRKSQGAGWSWDEAFEAAESKIESGGAKFEKALDRIGRSL